jgi:hypothetical protein
MSQLKRIKRFWYEFGIAVGTVYFLTILFLDTCLSNISKEYLFLLGTIVAFVYNKM